MIRARRVGPWRRILKNTRLPENKATQQHVTVLELSEESVELSPVAPFTCVAIGLLLLDAGSDGVVLLVDVLPSSDPAEDPASLLGAALLEEPAGALGKEEEADELHHGRHAGQAEHVPAGRETQRVADQSGYFCSVLL